MVFIPSSNLFLNSMRSGVLLLTRLHLFELFESREDFGNLRLEFGILGLQGAEFGNLSLLDDDLLLLQQLAVVCMAGVTGLTLHLPKRFPGLLCLRLS
jgi:hypothetical protein